MRVTFDRDERMLRWFNDSGEIAYVVFGLGGLQAEVEFPSDWHEQARTWVRLSLGLIRGAVSFPYNGKPVPDEYQCSGPTYGFSFFEDLLFVRYGKSKGRRDDPSKAFTMPWGWRGCEHTVLTLPESHGYTYTLRSGEVQNRVAKVYAETRTWWRPWLPWRKTVTSINVEFDGEVGERTGSWKGGTVGCGYPMLPGEAPVETLRRMERERVFD